MDQFEGFKNLVLNGMGTTYPEMEINGSTIVTKPDVCLSCDVEHADGDDHTIISNLRLKLYISFPESEEEGILVDLTLQESLQSLKWLFKNEMIPLHLIMAQPDKEFIGALVAQAVAKKAKYKVTIEEDRRNNEVSFRIVFAGHALEAVTSRDLVAEYFGWKPLSLKEIVYS